MDNKKKDSLSVIDIAEMAGVSVATVSRVINQNGRFSKETEDRVKEIIRKYNYQPNQLARGMRVSKTKIVGILVPDITNEFFANITLELQKQLLDNDYLTMICNTNEMKELEAKQINMLRAQRVAGIIYVAGNAKEKTKLDVPVIYIDRHPGNSVSEKDNIIIESDNRMGGYIATKELIERGCKNVVCVSFHREISAHENRILGYLDAVREAGLPERVCIVDRVSADESAKALRQMWEKDRNIDGAFCTTDTLALGVMEFCAGFGYSIPHSFKIVGYDDTSISQKIWPRLTTIRQSVETFGELGVKILLDLIAGEKPEQNLYQIPVELIRRGTT
ncbi:MAG: LacI family DNA-binding transcriptional regulator [Clostridia bacterium]|nr:LacI family DNA-binding transcriptional regulator [Clostridia bacterium]